MPQGETKRGSAMLLLWHPCLLLTHQLPPAASRRTAPTMHGKRSRDSFKIKARWKLQAGSKIVAYISLTCLLLSISPLIYQPHVHEKIFRWISSLLPADASHNRRICTNSNRTVKQLLCSSSPFQTLTEGSLHININIRVHPFVCWCSYCEVWQVPGLSTGTLQLDLSESICCSIKYTWSVICSLCLHKINIISNIITYCFFRVFTCLDSPASSLHAPVWDDVTSQLRK